MKHWIKTTLGIGLAIGLWQVSADARFLDLKKQENTLKPIVKLIDDRKLLHPAPVTTLKLYPKASACVLKIFL